MPVVEQSTELQQRQLQLQLQQGLQPPQPPWQPPGFLQVHQTPPPHAPQRLHAQAQPLPVQFFHPHHQFAQPASRSSGLIITSVRQTGKYDSMTEEKLDRWVEAKRKKDFATADRIRSELHSVGIKPDEVRKGNDGWSCAECGAKNWAKRSDCFKCKRPGGMPAADTDAQGSAGFMPPPPAMLPPLAMPPPNVTQHAQA